MKMRLSVLTGMALLVAMAAPVRAHCGVCGSDGKKGGEAKSGAHAHDEHAHGEGGDDGHAHADKAEIGAPAPNFSLKGNDGKTYTLADFKDKVVVLEWTNHLCPVVKRCHGSKLMSQTLGKFSGKPVVWLAIDSTAEGTTSDDAIAAWAKESGVSYPVLRDASGTVGQTYGAKTTPHMFVIDQKGVLAYAGALDNDPHGNLESGMRNYVEEAVTALLTGSTVVTSKTKSYGCGVKYAAK